MKGSTSFLFSIVLLATSLISNRAWAITSFFDANVFYVSDSGKTSSTDTSTKMFMDFALGFAIDKRAQFQVGWNYSIFSTNDTGSSDSSYSSTEMGPKFTYYFDRDRTWGFSLAYNLIVNADYKPSGGSTQKWRGSSIKADFGYGIMLSESCRLGLHLIYNSASFNERVSSTTLETVSFTRNFMYPAIHLSYLF